MKKLYTLLGLLCLLQFSHAQMVINEVLYDPSNSGLDGDANGDGAYSQTEDEFIELVNTGSFDFDLSGYQLWDDTISGQLRYTIPSGTIVPPGGAVVVFGGGVPTGNFGGAVVLTASVSANGLSLNNSGEIITLKNSLGQFVANFDSDALSDNPNESYTRNPDITGAFEQHSSNTALLFSPGTRIDGTPFDTVFVSPPPALAYTPMIINEVLYDPSNSGLDGDANGDGVYGQDDDSFIEFINTDSVNYDMSGYQIWDDTTTGTLQYTIPQGTIVPPGGAVVVFGGGTPTGSFGGAIVLTMDTSAGGMNLNNSGEVIVIFNSQGEPVLTFDSDALSNNPNESYTRNPDITGAFEQHNDNTLLLFSPGTRIDGTPFNTVYNPPIPTCNPNYNATTQITGNYTVKFSWSNLGYSSYSLNIREVGASTWSSFVVSGLQRTLENRAPGNYEFYVADPSGNDYSCTGTFAVGCATDIAYSYNGFQAPELGRLGRIRVFNTTGGKRKYDIYLVGSQGDTAQGLDRRQVNFTDLEDDTYSIYVRDAYGCQSDSVGSYTVNALDTAWIPNLINAPNNSPNGFRPTWNSVDGIINYQLRIQNVTDGTLQGFITGINDTMYAVTNLPTGKLYRFNVRSRYNNGVANVVSGYSNAVSRNLTVSGNKKEEALGSTAVSSVSLYPNPTKGLLYVQISTGSTLRLIDLNGRTISSRTASSTEEVLDLSALAAGVYLVEINSDGELHRERIVKE